MSGELVQFPAIGGSLSSAQAQAAAERVLSTPAAERVASYGELEITQPETLLAVCHLLDRKLESAPAKVSEDAAWFYDMVERLDASKAGFLFDERAYFLGELALLAGAACRFTSHRDDARTWLDRAEAWFLLTVSSPGEIARVGYQRLALKLEERQFREVLKLVGPLAEVFERLGARESLLKCRYLEATAFKETDKLAESLESFRSVLVEAEEIGSARIVGAAHVAIIQIYAEMGDAENALLNLLEAKPFLRNANNRVGIAKLEWAIGMLLRKQRKTGAAIEAFRSSQREFAEIHMSADIAALHLIIADLLLESGQEAQAEWEIRSALPVIDEPKMVPEGMAALSLLRESIRRRKIDRQALRDLHGYFEEIPS